MKLIVAVDENWGIGKKGDLLLSIPDDMKYFREKTKKSVLVMGYNTLLSFPNSKPLPGRLNIVLADVKGLRVEGAIVCDSIEQLLSLLCEFSSDDLYVIGGGMMYRQLLPYCDTALITKMQFTGEADTFIPNLDKEEGWNIIKESEEKDYEGLQYSFVEYHNDRAKPIDHHPSEIDITDIFERKEKLIFPILDAGDPQYREKLSSMVSAYFFPLGRGLTAQEIRDFYSFHTEAMRCSLSYYLHSQLMIAYQEDILNLNERFESEASTQCPICVTRKDAKSFIEQLKEAAFDEIISKNKV